LTDYLKIPEVARRLDVSEPTVRRMVKGGKLPSVFIGGAYRVSEEDLATYLESAKVQPGKAPAPPSQRSLFNGGEEERRYHRLQLLRELRDHVSDLRDRFTRDEARLEQRGTLEDWERLERDSAFACIGALSVLNDESGTSGRPNSEPERKAWRMANDAARDLNTVCDEIEARTEAMREAVGRDEDEGLRVLDAYRRRAG
jgi:excisionase family DNA binding protein